MLRTVDRLAKLRAGADVSPEMDAAMSGIMLATPGWFLAHGVTGHGWGWAVLALALGGLAMFTGFVLTSVLTEGLLG
jgi:hypothetical protein